MHKALWLWLWLWLWQKNKIQIWSLNSLRALIICIHSTKLSTLVCTLVHFEGRFFCGSNDHKHWFENPKVKPLKLELQNCIYSKTQWPKWYANVTLWCCHRKKKAFVKLLVVQKRALLQNSILPKVKTQSQNPKLKLQNCIYFKIQWPKWHANVTSWCCHRKKRPS